MAQTARKGQDVAVGVILTGRLSVIVNNDPVACEGDVIAPHVPGGPHNGSVIVGYEASVIAENQPVSRQGDATSCGHSIATGSGNVITGA